VGWRIRDHFIGFQGILHISLEEAREHRPRTDLRAAAFQAVGEKVSILRATAQSAQT
jgi:hypothetical protein